MAITDTPILIGPYVHGILAARSPGQTWQMSELVIASEQRSHLFAKKLTIFFTAVLAVVILPLVYLAIRGESGTTSLTVTSPSADPQQQPVDEQPNGTPSPLEQQSVTPSAVGGPEAGMTALPFLDKMRNIISNKRVLIAAIAVTLILVTLAAVIVTLYYSSQDDSGEAIEKAKRLLEEFEEQRRLREEKEAAEKAAREFHMTVAIGSAFFNVLIAIAAIQLAKFGNIKVQPIVQLALVLACVLLQQGAFLLLLAISVAIYEICRVFLTSPNRVAKVFVSLICTVASMVAFCCAILCLPVLLLAMTFRYGKLNLGAFFVNLAESVKGAVVYSFGGDPLPEFSPSSNFRW